MLILIDERRMQSIGVKPILADINKLPTVNKNDKVCIIQHPGGRGNIIVMTQSSV